MANDDNPAETPTWLLQDKYLERCFRQQSLYKNRKRTQYTLAQLSEATRQTTRKALPSLNIPRRSQGPNSIGRAKGHNVRQRVNDPSQVINRSMRRDPLGGSERVVLGELDSMGEPMRDICLVRSLRALGVPVECSTSGPFRALRDGNEMLRNHGMELVPVGYADIGHGNYVHWHAGHFMAMCVDKDIKVKDGTYWHRVSSLDCLGTSSAHKFFKLVRVGENAIGKGLSQRQIWNLQQTRDKALLRRMYIRETPTAKRPRVQFLSLVQPSDSSGTNVVNAPTGLHRPSPPLAWAPVTMPATPANFEHGLPRLPIVRFLEVLNSHPRDSRLRFFADDHKYTWDGQPTLGSVTGLIHRFTRPFIEDEVIDRMINGRNWPRVGYLALPVSDDIIDELRCSPTTSHLVQLLLVDRPDERAIIVEANRLRHLHPGMGQTLSVLEQDSDTIKQNWERNRTCAANAGTWMHWTLEAYLNSAIRAPHSPEFSTFMKLVPELNGFTAYRTEWTVYADYERLAGSIDFVAKNSAGEAAYCVSNPIQQIHQRSSWRRHQCCRLTVRNRCTQSTLFGRQSTHSTLVPIS